MILALKIILGLGLMALIARYVPGFKCISYCKYRTYKYNKAIAKIKTLPYHPGIVVVDITSLSKKQLINLYEQSTPFGCRSLYLDDNTKKVREQMKNAIAESELLED